MNFLSSLLSNGDVSSSSMYWALAPYYVLNCEDMVDVVAFLVVCVWTKSTPSWRIQGWKCGPHLFRSPNPWKGHNASCPSRLLKSRTSNIGFPVSGLEVVSAAFRCSTSSLFTYLTPKSSTHNANWIGHDLCIHNPLV
jgi:hypothetical protein